MPGTSTPTPASSNNAVVTEEKTKKPKKMAGRSPAQVCRQINELKLDNKVVNLKRSRDVLPWIRRVYLDGVTVGMT